MNLKSSHVHKVGSNNVLIVDTHEVDNDMQLQMPINVRMCVC